MINVAEKTQQADSQTNQIVWAIFGADAGELIEDFSCAYEKNFLLHGRMYVTTRCLCFYSNLFGHEKKLRIPYAHIVSVKKGKTALVIDNAIYVTTSRFTYQFRSFWDRDECFLLLDSVLSHSRQAQGGEGEEEGARRVRRSMSENPSSNKTREEQSVSSPSTGKEREEDECPDVGRDDEVVAVSAEPEDFDALCLRLTLRIPVITDEPLPLSLADFLDRFVLDGAPLGWAEYHARARDSKIETSLWEPSSSNATEWRRQIKFFKPVNLPGLKSTRGIKYQILTVRKGVGAIVCSSTWLEDVPAAKSFSVDDVVVVRAAGESVRVSVSFEVKFLQSTMFRYVIESGTNGEMIKWLDAFFAFLKKSSGDAVATPMTPVPLLETEVKRRSALEATVELVERNKGVLVVALLLLLLLTQTALFATTLYHSSWMLSRMHALELKLAALVDRGRDLL